MGDSFSRLIKTGKATLTNAYDVASAIRTLTNPHFVLDTDTSRFEEDIYRMILFKSGDYHICLKHCNTVSEFDLLLDAITASQLTLYFQLVNATACAVVLIKNETLPRTAVSHSIWTHFFPEL